jgi:PLP dependent protein
MSAEGEVDMKLDPSRAKALSSAISSVTQRIEAVAGGRNVSLVFLSHLIRRW